MTERSSRQEPEWLTRWREAKSQIDPDSVETTIPPFGVIKRRKGEIGASLDKMCVYVFVSGTATQRRRISRLLKKGGAEVVSYSAALAEVRKHKASHSEYQLGGHAWSVVRADVSTLIRAGESVVVDALFTGRKDMERFSQYCFMSGARGVVALCLTTEYEEGWEDDGFSGVIWLFD